MPCNGSRMLRLQEQFLNLGIGMVADFPFPVAATVECPVVHDDENAVLCTLQVQLNHVDTHVDGVLEGLQGVLWRSTPVASVSNDGYIFRVVQKVFT